MDPQPTFQEVNYTRILVDLTEYVGAGKEADPSLEQLDECCAVWSIWAALDGGTDL